MIKQIGRHNILVSPFVAVKKWNLENINNKDVVLLEELSSSVLIPDTSVALEYVDYTTNPISINTDCDIALEQQDADAAKYQEGISGSGLFNIESEDKNLDGTFKRLVYDQTKRAFYNQYRNPTQIFGIDNIDFSLSKIDRYLADEFLMFNIPRKIMGDKLSAGTIRMHDATIDDNVDIYDDSNGNLLAGKNLFSKIQEVRSIVNIFLDGSSSFLCPSFTVPTGSPTGSPETSSQKKFYWNYIANSCTDVYGYYPYRTAAEIVPAGFNSIIYGTVEGLVSYMDGVPLNGDNFWIEAFYVNGGPNQGWDYGFGTVIENYDYPSHPSTFYDLETAYLSASIEATYSSGSIHVSSSVENISSSTAPTCPGYIPEICHWSNYLALIDPGVGGSCSSSIEPAWGGVFNLNTTWQVDSPLYYFNSQSIMSRKVSADNAPDYPSGDWQNNDTFTRMYWDDNDTSWNLILACTNGNILWSGIIQGAAKGYPAGKFIRNGGSIDPVEIEVVINDQDCAYTIPTLIMIPQEERSSSIMTSGNNNIRSINGNYYVTSYNNTNKVLTSTDGYAWTSTTVTMNDGNRDVAYDGTTYIMATQNLNTNTGNSGIIYTSTDGMSWNRVDTGVGTSNNGNYRSIAYGVGTFVILGFETPIYSTDGGVTWIETTSIGNVNNVNFLHNRFVASTTTGVFYSTDGISWTDTGLSGNFRSSEYLFGRYIVVGESGAYAKSTDGTTWTPLVPMVDGSPNGTLSIYGISFGNTTQANFNLLMVDGNGVIYNSVDGGDDWLTFAQASTSLSGIAFNGDATFTVVEG